MTDITIRPVDEKDFPQIVDLFSELALFEKMPDKMVNSVDLMIAEKDLLYILNHANNKIYVYCTKGEFKKLSNNRKRHRNLIKYFETFISENRTINQ